MRFRAIVVAVLVSAVAAACGSQVPEATFDQLVLGDGALAARTATDGSRERVDAAPAAPDLDGSDAPTPPEPVEAAERGDLPDATGDRQPAPRDDGGRGQQEVRANNVASDVGVTADEIRVGIITARSGPLGPHVFSPAYDGANAYFARLNAQGGVNGRTIRFIHCDDAMDRSRNRQCARSLVEEHEVFALVGTSTEAYAAAGYVAEHGVPDIGQPIGTPYWTYPTHYSITGSVYPRDGEVGYGGTLWGHNAQFLWVFANVEVATVGIVAYDVTASSAYAQHLADLARHTGAEAVVYLTNPAFPNFDSVVANMAADGVDAIWDAMDFVGNHNLCRAMARHDFSVRAKVHTAQGWTRRVRDFPAVCRENLYAIGGARASSDTRHPEVAAFRETIRRLYGADYERNLHQWALEGWASARLFTEGVRSMGAEVTREGLIAWLDAWTWQGNPYDGDGLHSAQAWSALDFETSTTYPNCIMVVRWDDRIAEFLPAGEQDHPHCFDAVDYLPWAPPS